MNKTYVRSKNNLNSICDMPMLAEISDVGRDFIYVTVVNHFKNAISHGTYNDQQNWGSFFLPDKHNEKICNAIASVMGSDNPLILDMTHPDTRSEIIANANWPD